VIFDSNPEHFCYKCSQTCYEGYGEAKLYKTKRGSIMLPRLQEKEDRSRKWRRRDRDTLAAKARPALLQ